LGTLPAIFSDRIFNFRQRPASGWVECVGVVATLQRDDVRGKSTTIAIRSRVDDDDGFLTAARRGGRAGVGWSTAPVTAAISSRASAAK
jgi:hypothetical protein